MSIKPTNTQKNQLVKLPDVSPSKIDTGTNLSAAVPLTLASSYIPCDGVDTPASPNEQDLREALLSRRNKIDGLGCERQNNRSLDNMLALRMTDAGNKPKFSTTHATDGELGAALEQRLGSKRAFKKLADEPRFAALAPQDQLLFAEVFKAMGAGNDDLRLLAHVDKRDLVGMRMLDSMHRLASEPLPKQLNRKRLLSEILDEIDNASTIDQTGNLTCTATAMQYALVLAHPAEYARLVTSLAIEGRAKLASGKDIARVSDSLERNRNEDRRSNAERLFQAAVMDLGNGPDWEYFDRYDQSAQIYHGVLLKSTGLDAIEIEDACEALFGKNYDVDIFAKHDLKAEDKSPTNPSYKAIIQRMQNRPLASSIVSLTWKDAQPASLGTPAQPARSHAVNFIKAENGRVYFRNPQGPDGSLFSNKRSDPPRQVEDGETGLESMTEEEFAKRLNLVIVPSTNAE